jgi:hypothetical protein
MTVTAQLLGFIIVALSTVAILVVGTLIAADIIHLGRRGPAPHGRNAGGPRRAEKALQAFAPLGSSVVAGSDVRAEDRTRSEPPRAA